LEKIGGINMSKKSKKKNNLKEEKIMENNNIEELNQNIEDVTEVTEETTEEVTETVEQVEESTNEVEESTDEVQETIEEVTEPEVIVPNIEDGVENNEVIGKISGFEKLYVRKEANIDSEPIGVVTDKDDLSIDISHSTNDFYKVITSNGLEGYCVKEFVKID
jgi:ATP-dependent 26S proteasome regulatory subunit